MKVALPEIRHALSGFEALVQFHATTKRLFFEDIYVDMSGVQWFDADMCSPFGALLHCLGQEVNSVHLIDVPRDVEKILSRNGFLSNYGRQRIPDTWGTTIPYRRFAAKDDRYFAAYIEDELIRRSEMPRMSSGLLKKFRESLFEIFSNAVIHSRTRLGIFTCGQYFPKKRRLCFSVADLGIGIRGNIHDIKGLNLSAVKAIDWATEGANTTKRGRIPGGLGLKLLSEFIKLNGGRLTIVSDEGFWSCSGDGSEQKTLNAAFPGTVVSIEINAADERSYRLTSEVSANDVF